MYDITSFVSAIYISLDLIELPSILVDRVQFVPYSNISVFLKIVFLTVISHVSDFKIGEVDYPVDAFTLLGLFNIINFILGSINAIKTRRLFGQNNYLFYLILSFSLGFLCNIIQLFKIIDTIYISIFTHPTIIALLYTHLKRKSIEQEIQPKSTDN